MYRLAILNSHPIQYFAPLYKRIAQEPDIELTVYYCEERGSQAYFDTQFGKKVKWDIPLLDGYNYQFLPNHTFRKNKPGFFRVLNPSIISELRRERFDALWLHGHNYSTYIMAMLAAKSVGTALFMRCETHLLLEASPLKQKIRTPLMTAFYKMFDACLPIGTLNADFYKAQGVEDRKLFQVPYTVDNQFFHTHAAKYQEQLPSVRKTLGIQSTAPIILYASKLTKRKYPIHVLQAFQRLQNEGVEAVLLFVGSGEEEQNLKDFVQQDDIKHVYFLGFQNQTELPKFYALADVFVLPAKNEPWGLIINEVMAASLPVIVSQEIGAAVDLVIPGENGFTFPSGNIDLLTTHLKTILQDNDLRQKMRIKSWERMQHWSFENCIDGIRGALSYISSAK